MSVGDKQAAGDGSTATDAQETVEIERDGPERYRWVCPRGHVKWDRTNNHVWCHSCRQQAENGEDVDPEWFEIHDQKTGRTIPWEAIEVVE